MKPKEQIACVSGDTRDHFLKEEKISSQEIYRGAVLHVTKDTVRLPNGKESLREVAWHDGAVAILPIFEDGSVLFEHQYRYAHGRVVKEIPAGKLDSPDEDMLSAAKRELREETGYTAEKWTDLGITIPSVAILGERIRIFLAEGLTGGEVEPDEDEFLHLERIPFDTLLSMVLSGEIEDSKTQVAVLKYQLLKNQKSKRRT
ncbi:MAG: NUDIX hydrolase [Clostridia bacterium]|nr:NUDIX hydrolase [Clostridia bacterium]